jgi:hypothetical protein
MDLATILKISEWLQVEPSTLVNSLVSSSTDGLADEIAILLRSNSLLAKEFLKAVTAINKGQVDPSLIEDMAAYAAYKFKLSMQRQ